MKESSAKQASRTKSRLAPATRKQDTETPKDRYARACRMLAQPEGVTRASLQSAFGFKGKGKGEASRFRHFLSRIEKSLGVVIATERRKDSADDVLSIQDVGRVAIDVPATDVIPAVLALGEFADQMLRPPGTAAANFANTLAAKFNPEQAALYEAAKDRVRLRFTATRQGRPEVLTMFLRALAEQRPLRFDYCKGDEFAKYLASEVRKTKPREDPDRGGSGAKAIKRGYVTDRKQVEVHGVFFARRSLYAIVRNHEPESGPKVAKAARGGLADTRAARPASSLASTAGARSGVYTVKLARIVGPVEFGTGSFERIEELTVDRYLENAWETWVTDTPPVRVVVDVEAAFGSRICDTTWHHSQKHKILSDGTHRFEFMVSGFEEMRFWVAWLGEGATVKEPPEFVEVMREMIGKMRQRYEP